MKKINCRKNQFNVYLTQALSGRAEVYHLIGKEQEALVDYDSLMHKDIDLRTSIDALAAASDINIRLGNMDRAISYSDQINKSVRHNQNVFWRGRAMIIRANILRNTGDYGTALVLIKRSVSHYKIALRRKPESINDRRMINEGIAHAYHSIGIIHYGYGRYDSAEKYFSKSAYQMGRLGNRIGQIQSLNNIALIHWHRGSLGQAERIFLRILKMAMEMGHKSGIAYIMQNLGLVVNDMGRLREGLRKFDEAIKYASAIGDIGLTAINYNNIGITFERLNRFAEAFENYKKSMDLFRRIDHLPGLAMANNNLAGIFCEWNKHKKSLFFIDRAISIAEKGGFTDMLIRSCKTKGRILTLMGEYEKSTVMIDRSYNLAKENKMIGLSIDAAIAYMGSMIIAWTDSAVNEYRQSKYYAGLLESFVEKGTLTLDDRVLMISVLARYYSIQGSQKKMFAMISRLEKNDKKLENVYILAEVAMAIAVVQQRSGKSWHNEMIKARKYAQQIDSKALLYCIKKLEKRLKKDK